MEMMLSRMTSRVPSSISLGEEQLSRDPKPPDAKQEELEVGLTGQVEGSRETDEARAHPS